MQESAGAGCIDDEFCRDAQWLAITHAIEPHFVIGLVEASQRRLVEIIDAEFLRLVYLLMRQYDIDPGRLIHALQNHDELTMGLAHFSGAHAGEHFPFHGGQLTGAELRDLIRRQMYARLLGERVPYNLKFGDGVASTTATVIADNAIRTLDCDPSCSCLLESMILTV